MRGRGVLALALVAHACSDDRPVDVSPTIEITFPAAPSRQLDVLFVVHDSPGNPEKVGRFGAELSPLVAAFAGADLHVGVVTSDLGTTGSSAPGQPAPAIGVLGNGGCAGAGRDGALVDQASLAERYIIDEDDGLGGRRRNYAGDLASIIEAQLRVGAGGCGFEQPLAAARRAFANPANAGFRRDGAHLALVIVGDEDDCSFHDAGLVTTATSTLGPLQSFRCTESGITCAEPVGEIGTKSRCMPRDDSPYVEPIATTIDVLRAAVPDPSQLTVMAIVGPIEPFVVEARSPPGGGEAIAGLARSCDVTTAFGLTIANPAVRTRAFAREFQGRGGVASICSADPRAPMRELGRLVKHPLGTICLDTSVLADASIEPGVQPSCELFDVAGDLETPISPCPADGDCFELVGDATACNETPDHLRLVVHRSTAPLAGYVRAVCATSP